MSTFDDFDRDLKFAVEEITSPAAAGKAMAVFAKVELARAIAMGAPRHYEVYVGGVKDRAEKSVRPPEDIVYVFTSWSEVIVTALDELRKRSPVRTGRYKASFLVLADQQAVLPSEYDDIPALSEVIIFNVQPYTRRIEVGANKSKGKRHFDLSRLAVNRKYKGSFKTEVAFLNITTGVHPLVPYILKNAQGKRKDRQAGSPITYPALVINAE